MKSCPVCKKSNLPDSEARCPQCNSDLTCFEKLEQLTSLGVQMLQPRRHYFYLSVALGNFAFLSLAVICFWIWTLHKDLETKITVLSDRLSNLSEQGVFKIQSLDKRLEKAENLDLGMDQKLKTVTDEITRLSVEISKKRPIQKRIYYE